ncbi:hypothetical protein A2964_01735 [Candidatus Daviesbacteria bacterium RIFCSPLOWO2_01_FULL_40_27]|nr:MAG: hypothetical protein A2964_01735 [Candidatus Daviesbacteria bacterium RIFCSPLOWO2_01_FULL_40_27]
MGIGAEKMIWIILAVGLILRLISLNQSLWLDEAINVVASRDFSFWGMITQYAPADFHPPGWFVILWTWGKLFGYSEISVRLPSVIFGVITIYITYLLGRKLVSKELGLVAALLLSINPLHIYYSQEARMYALAALAVAVNVLLLVKIIKGEKVNLFFLIISNLFVLLSDYIAYFIFPAQFIFLLFLKKGEIIKRWVVALLSALALGVFWLPIFLAQLNIGTVASANLPTWKFVAGGFDFKTIPLTFVKFIIGRISLADKVTYTAVLLPVGSLFAYLLWRGQNKLGDFRRSLLIAWGVIPIVLASIISIAVPVYSYFRVLFIVPAFIILIASGILSFKKFRYGFLTVVVLIELFCTLVYLLNPVYQREDWKGLVSNLQSLQPSVVLFESSGTLPPFDYYAKGSLNAKGALRDFPAKDKSSVSDLGSLLKGKNKVYLVDYLVQISDPQRLVAKELDDLGYQEKDIKNFNGVGFVYYYEKSD